jgi:transcription antitermination factor NusG
MPLLPPEPSQFPDTLLAEPPSSPTGDERWWVAYTKSKAEKSLARHLRGRRVAHYLPLEAHNWRKNGRAFVSYLPLFPGYVFLYGDDASRVAALESNVVSRILDVPEQRRLLNDLRRVDRMLSAELPLERSDILVPGQKVNIVAGPLGGLHGTLVRHGGQLRLVVEVTFLRQAVSAEIEAWMVEPAAPTVGAVASG